jgi:hypothetical protein
MQAARLDSAQNQGGCVKYQYVCIFDDEEEGGEFKIYIKKYGKSFSRLEDAGHTICFVGSKKMLSVVERYRLPDDATMHVERRPAGIDSDQAAADGLEESFVYHGSGD